MSAVKRAFMSLLRNKIKTFIVFLIMIAIASLLMTTLVVFRGTVRTQKKLEQRLMSTVSVSRDEYNATLYDYNSIPMKDYEQYYTGPKIDQNLYDTIMGDPAIDEGNWERANPYDLEFEDRVSLVPAKTYKAIQDGDYASFQMSGIMGPVKMMLYAETIRCYGNNNSELNTWFTSGSFELIEGRHIHEKDHGTILVSDAFAKLNNLSVGDVLHIGISSLMNECDFLDEEYLEDHTELMDQEILDKREFIFTCPVTIVGIYEPMLQDAYGDYDFEQNRQENMFFIDSLTNNDLVQLCEQYSNQNIAQFRYYPYEKMSFHIADATMIDSVVAQLKTQIMEADLLAWRTNEQAYSAAVAPVLWIQRVVLIAAVLIALSGAVILMLVLLFWSRARKKEVATELAIGITKGSVLIQFITEAIFLTLIAVLIVTLFTSTFAHQAESRLLTRGIEESQEASMFERDTSIPVDPIMQRDRSTTYRNFTPNHLELNLTVGIVIQTFGIMSMISILAMLLANIPSFTTGHKRKRLES